MKALITSALLGLCALSIGAVSTNSKKITGDYVEARTASVFAGACHYNGELVTTGRDAIMAWSFNAGSFNGVDLAGVKAAASVTSDASLGDEHAARKVELVVDTQATSAQATAVAELVKEKVSAKLGQIVTVRRAPVSFAHTSNQYAVKVEGFASMTVSPMPDNACCAQPNLVWYSPLSPIENRKVGYTSFAAYTAGSLGEPWQRESENSAFYGTFTF